MMTYGCRKEDQPELAGKFRELVEVLAIPARIIEHQGGGVGLEWTIRGRDKASARARSAAHWALMDAEQVLKLWGLFGVRTSACATCGCSCANYDHTPAFCRGVVDLARRWGVELEIVSAMCTECGQTYVNDSRKPHRWNLCPRCDEQLFGDLNAGRLS